MERSAVLVVSQDLSRSEPMLALLRNKQCWPVLSCDAPPLTRAVADDTRVSLVVLNGCKSFCDPYLECHSQNRLRGASPRLIVVAVESSEAFAVAALRAGAADYFAEPLDVVAFAQSISRWVPVQAPENGLTGGDALVGETPAMQALRLHIRRVAATDCNVLITGETGTGKELVAQLVHHNSARNRHPLICINCAAIPDSLLESELFGYEKGAFTGAHASSQGKLMTANKGSVFFDEIGDMSPCAQAKILRAIEMKEVQRLGASRRYETDIRILAATHHNLDELSGPQPFRRDLYFRLNVGRIHLTPLRERKADISRLVERMVTDLNHKLGRRIEGATEGAMRALVQYEWPGNIRELKNVIERTFITRDSGQISEEDLPPELQPSSGPRSSSPRPPPAPHKKEEEELQSLRAALVTCNGNKSKAAERLNCSRMTLYRKIAKYGLEEGRGKASATANDSPDSPRKLA